MGVCVCVCMCVFECACVCACVGACVCASSDLPDAMARRVSRNRPPSLAALATLLSPVNGDSMTPNQLAVPTSTTPSLRGSTGPAVSTPYLNPSCVSPHIARFQWYVVNSTSLTSSLALVSGVVDYLSEGITLQPQSMQWLT